MLNSMLPFEKSSKELEFGVGTSSAAVAAFAAFFLI
jgi:hypothetical protein